jgi:hypothetical protein
MHWIATGQYETFRPDVPIVADLWIARVSLSSGLLRPSERVSLFRIDSLVWQIGGPAYRCRHNRATTEAGIGNIREGYGADPPAARSVAGELTNAL